MKAIREAWPYLRRWGIKRFVAASLLYLGRKVDHNISIQEVDFWAGIKSLPPRLVGKLLEEFNISDEDIRITKEINDSWKNSTTRKIDEILWIMPDFSNVYNGGPHTILRFAHFFGNKYDIHNTIVIVNANIHRNKKKIIKAVREAFPNSKNVDFIVYPFWKEVDIDDLPDSDVAIATIWHSAYLLLRYHRTKAKYYFVQDYEPLFYPAGVEFGLADATYDFGFFHICNTEGIFKAVSNNHAIEGTYFTPGVDRDVFYPSERSSINRIFFYARPSVPRNGFDLGVSGIRLIKKEFPDVEILMAGHYREDFALDFEAKFLGYLPYDETGELYRHCGAGISFMFTPHPSYIPLQMMACGCIVIANRNSYNSWLLKDGYNCILCGPTPRGILEAYRKLRNDRNLREKLRSNGIATVASLSWEEEMSKILYYMLRK